MMENNYSKGEDKQVTYTSFKTFDKKIETVGTFVNDEGKKVQFIFTSCKIMEIIRSFDLSICACWSMFENCKYEFYFLDYENTKKKLMYYISSSCTERETKRLQKYIDRGYSLIKCPFEEMSKFRVDLL